MDIAFGIFLGIVLVLTSPFWFIILIVMLTLLWTLLILLLAPFIAVIDVFLEILTSWAKKD